MPQLSISCSEQSIIALWSILLTFEVQLKMHLQTHLKFLGKPGFVLLYSGCSADRTCIEISVVQHVCVEPRMLGLKVLTTSAGRSFRVGNPAESQFGKLQKYNLSSDDFGRRPVAYRHESETRENEKFHSLDPLQGSSKQDEKSHFYVFIFHTLSPFLPFF